MDKVRILWSDTETGDKLPEKCALLQVAAVITRPEPFFSGAEGYFMSYVKPQPGLTITSEALAINGLDPSKLQCEPDEKKVAELFAAFCWAYAPLRFGGFNCEFDSRVLKAMLKRHKIEVPPFEAPWLDVMIESRNRLKQLPRHRLVDVRDHFKISCDGAHDAARDIADTIKIAKYLYR